MSMSICRPFNSHLLVRDNVSGRQRGAAERTITLYDLVRGCVQTRVHSFYTGS